MPLNNVLVTWKEEGLTGLVSCIKDRLGVKARFLIVALLLVIPAVLALLFIKHYAVNVASFDDLAEGPPMFSKFYAGHLSFGDFFKLSDAGNRPVTYRIGILLFGLLTHFNEVAMCYFTWCVMCVIVFVFYLALVRAFKSRQTALVALIPIVWLVFSVRQTDHLIKGGASFEVLAILFFLLAIYSLTASTGLRWRLPVSIACGVLSTYSQACGLLVWPIGLIVILWIRQSQPEEVRRSYLRMAAIWCLVGVAVFLAYFINAATPGSSNTELLLHHPQSALRFFVLALGGLMYYKYPAYVFGLLMVPLYALVLVTMVSQAKAQPSTALALALILFGVSSAVVVTWGRLSYGIEQALEGRYTTYTNPGIVGLYLGILSLKPKYIHVRPFLVGFATCLMVLGIAISHVTTMKIVAPQYKAVSSMQAYVLSTYRVQSDELLQGVAPYWSIQTIKEGAQVFEKHRLNVFSKPSLKPDDLIPDAGSTASRIEGINNVVLGPQDSGIINLSLQNGTVTVSGWAVDQAAKRPAGAVFVTIDGQIDIPARYGFASPIVAAYTGESHYRYSGFVAWFATSFVGEGQHTLSLKIVSSDKKRYYESAQKITLEVK